MAVDLIQDQSPQTGLDVRRPADPVGVVGVAPTVGGGGLPRVLVAPGAVPDAVGALLLAVAHGSQEALVALESRMGGLVRVNVRRILRDAMRSDAVTREVFADVLGEAATFDPGRDDGRSWLLTRAHERAMDLLGPGPVGSADAGSRGEPTTG